MTTSSNAYCAVLGIRAPRVEDAKSSPDANYYSLLLVALLEQGEPMTLEPEDIQVNYQGRAITTETGRPSRVLATAEGAVRRLSARRTASSTRSSSLPTSSARTRRMK